MLCNPNFRLSKATLSQAANRVFLILSLGLVSGVIYRYYWLGKPCCAVPCAGLEDIERLERSELNCMLTSCTE